MKKSATKFLQTKFSNVLKRLGGIKKKWLQSKKLLSACSQHCTGLVANIQNIPLEKNSLKKLIGNTTILELGKRAEDVEWVSQHRQLHILPGKLEGMCGSAVPAR